MRSLELTSRIAAGAERVAAHLARPESARRLRLGLGLPQDAAPVRREILDLGADACLLRERWASHGDPARLLPALRARRLRLESDLDALAPLAPGGRRRVAITGASGLIGAALGDLLEAGGHEVIRISRRRAAGPGWSRWDPAAGAIDAERLEGLDAAFHLAGESIAGGRWSPARKALLRESRVGVTALLAGTLAGLERRPGRLVSASAVGYYGDGGEASDEDAPAGDGWLAELVRDWEAATAPAAAAGIPVLTPRLGVVLSGAGGALAVQRPVFALGLGGPLGSGRQLLPWIALDDLLRALCHAAFAPGFPAGPCNATAPAALSQRDFARTLGRVLGRPALLPAPGPALRLILGEMAGPLLLAGARARPTRLEAAGFRWLRGELEPALRAELGLWRQPLPDESTRVVAD